MKQQLASDNSENKSNNFATNRKKNIFLKLVRKSRFLRRNYNYYKKPDTTNDFNDC